MLPRQMVEKGVIAT